MQEVFAYLGILFQLIRAFWPIIVIPIVAVILRRWVEKKSMEREQDRIAKKIAEELKKDE